MKNEIKIKIKNNNKPIKIQLSVISTGPKNSFTGGINKEMKINEIDIKTNKIINLKYLNRL